MQEWRYLEGRGGKGKEVRSGWVTSAIGPTFGRRRNRRKLRTGTGDVLLWVLKVLEEGLLGPAADAEYWDVRFTAAHLRLQSVAFCRAFCPVLPWRSCSKEIDPGSSMRMPPQIKGMDKR